MNTVHNLDNLTDEQIGTADGWRLLDEDEIGESFRLYSMVLMGIEVKASHGWLAGNSGENLLLTYRTRLSRAELREARGLEPEEPNFSGGVEADTHSPKPLVITETETAVGCSQSRTVAGVAPGPLETLSGGGKGDFRAPESPRAINGAVTPPLNPQPKPESEVKPCPTSECASLPPGCNAAPTFEPDAQRPGDRLRPEFNTTVRNFRKKPVVIQAVQYHGDMRIKDCLPEGVVIVPKITGGDAPIIHTLEGDMAVREGDWIITGVKGERYPCKPDIFAATYEPVDAPQQPTAQPSLEQLAHEVGTQIWNSFNAAIAPQGGHMRETGREKIEATILRALQSATEAKDKEIAEWRNKVYDLEERKQKALNQAAKWQHELSTERDQLRAKLVETEAERVRSTKDTNALFLAMSEQLDAAIARAEKAERERDAIVRGITSDFRVADKVLGKTAAHMSAYTDEILTLRAELEKANVTIETLTKHHRGACDSRYQHQKNAFALAVELEKARLDLEDVQIESDELDSRMQADLAATKARLAEAVNILAGLFEEFDNRYDGADDSQSVHWMGEWLEKTRPYALAPLGWEEGK